MSKKQKVAYYVLLVIVSLLFVYSGIAKLLAQDMAVAGFAAIGLPVWFMYVIGAGEVLGGLGLWVRQTFRYAYEGLFLILAGAFFTTIPVAGFAVALFPLGTAVALGFIVWLHGKRA